MREPFFFSFAFSPTLGDIAAFIGADCGAAADLKIAGLAPIESAGPHDLVYFDNPHYLAALETTRAGACFIRAAMRARLPAHVAALVVEDPYRAFALTAARLIPDSLRPAPLSGPGIASGAHIHPAARLEPGVDVEPGAIIGPDVEIGAGSLIGANAVIGAGVRIGRNCFIGPTASLFYALLGDRVVLHPGVRIGQDGFGFSMGARGHVKVPQIGRVIIQDDVEIGANTSVDRGATRDTIIGEGTKIDNLVQIGHNATIGRHCILVAQCGVAGSAELSDFVAVGGQAGIAGHLHIGRGARIAAQAGVMRDVPAGAKVGGSPAQNLRHFLKQAARARRPENADAKGEEK